MRFLGTKILLFIIITWFVYSCSTTKKVPEGEFLLTKNKFEFQGKEKPFNSVLQDYVKQRPNGGALFGYLPLKLMLYNSVHEKFDTTFMEYYDLTKKKRTQKSLDSLLVKNGLEEYVGNSLWIRRFLFNQGEPPVIIDTALTSFSEENLETFYFDRGYFDAEVNSEHDLDSSSKKGKVVYEINPGEESIINSYSYNISDSTVYNHYQTLMTRGGEVKVGDRYDVDNFILERNRIMEYLQNRGYYQFNHDGQDIEFTADTTISNKSLDVTLLMPKGIDKDSTKANQHFSKYRYGTIHIYPDSNYDKNSDQQINYYDTIYDGYHLHYVDPKMKYRPKFFTDAIVLRDSGLYRLTSEQQTKRNIFKREGVTMTGFINDWNKENPNLIQGDSILDVHISFRPKKKYDLFYGAELSWSEFMNFGVSPRVSLIARNLFGGGENLETTLRGTLGNVNKKFTDEGSFFNAFEMAFQTKIGFPYLVFPFNLDKVFPKRYYKQSDVRLGASVQNNIGLGRVTYSSGLDYNISFRDAQTHTISILNNEFVNNLQRDNYFKVFSGDNTILNDFVNNYYFDYNPSAAIQHFNGDISDDELIQMVINDQTFQETLDDTGRSDYSLFQNMNFRKQSITQNVFISSMFYQYTLNQAERPNIKNPWFFRGKIELAGNILGLMDKAFGFYKSESTTGKEQGMVFNVPYSQFVKLDLDVRKYFNFSPKTSWANRFYVGIIQPYGNSDFVPFVRSYTAGGANDIRAWAAATLGPADIPRFKGGDDVFAIEQLKLLFSTEYRFNMMGMFNGAFFVDAGNIWGTDKDNELTLFKFDEFYKQLGIGGGFGLRMDLTFLIARLDFAYKLHDPSYPEGDRWRFDNFNILKPRIAFGINYPF